MLNGGKADDTAAATFLEEGSRTIGVWLPLALADLNAAMIAIIRMFAANHDEIKVPKRSESLGSWALPMMSRAIEADEKERDALEMFRSIERLSKRKNAK